MRTATSKVFVLTLRMPPYFVADFNSKRQSLPASPKQALSKREKEKG